MWWRRPTREKLEGEVAHVALRGASSSILEKCAVGLGFNFRSVGLGFNFRFKFAALCEISHELQRCTCYLC